MTLPIVTPGPDARRRIYAATATEDTSAGTQSFTDLILDGGDGVGITVPDPGGDAQLLIWFSVASLTSDICAALFEIYVDGIFVGGGAPTTSTAFGPQQTFTMSVVAKQPIKEGAPHVIRVRWKANVGTMAVHPDARDLGNAPYHATLIVEMVPIMPAHPAPYPVGQAELDVQRAILSSWTFAGAIPTGLPDVVERDWDGAPLPVGCAQIDRFTVTDMCGRGGTGYSWLLYPTVPVGNQLILAHSGHEQSWDGDNVAGLGRTLENTQFWLAQGFYVLAVDMPATAPPGRQPNPLTLVVDDVATPFTSHAFGSLDEAEDGLARSLAPFLEPALRGVSQALVDLGLTSYYAIGISGGGITVELLAALDIRCRNRYSVFGGIPWEIMASVPPSHLNPADSEQWAYNPAMIRGAMHLMRYALGADHGRRAVNIWANGDPITPVTLKHNEIEEFRLKVLALLDGAGDFVVQYDTEASQHQYTDQTLNWVAADILANP